jgi:hypothetical protein
MARSQEDRQDARPRPDNQPVHEGEERARRRRGRNLAILAVLIAFCVAVYLVALTRMGGL